MRLDVRTFLVVSNDCVEPYIFSVWAAVFVFPKVAYCKRFYHVQKAVEGKVCEDAPVFVNACALTLFEADVSIAIFCQHAVSHFLKNFA